MKGCLPWFSILFTLMDTQRKREEKKGEKSNFAIDASTLFYLHPIKSLFPAGDSITLDFFFPFSSSFFPLSLKSARDPSTTRVVSAIFLHTNDNKCFNPKTKLFPFDVLLYYCYKGIPWMSKPKNGSSNKIHFSCVGDDKTHLTTTMLLFSLSHHAISHCLTGCK